MRFFWEESRGRDKNRIDALEGGGERRSPSLTSAGFSGGSLLFEELQAVNCNCFPPFLISKSLIKNLQWAVIQLFMTMSRQLRNSRRWQSRFRDLAYPGDEFRSGQSWPDQLSGNRMLTPLEKLTWGKNLITPAGDGWGHRSTSILLCSSVCQQGHCIRLLGLPVLKYHRLGGLKNRNL